ncbi:hypothetical protein V5739_16410 [Salinimicrobium sp. TIG7-5_MAKvit]|uniref:hypothetical protein n=1 Tax=Salinimicrobium sp. TIG7-5_MAKvit TaxID=3121289 RepID=UPI003C6E0A81
MKSLYAFCLLFVLAFLPATSRPIDGELVIRLQEDEKLTGTFSGDIDQQTSVHLLFLKNKKDDHYIVKPFFIDAHRNITALETSVFKEEPSVVSYHLKDDMLTLLLQQGKRKEQNLEILEFNTLNGDVQQFTVANFKEPYLLLRTKEKTFLLNKEDDQVEVVTILGAGEPQKTTLNLTNVSKETIEKLFKEKPETINTEEFVEHGSILPSKLYYSGDKLVFDYKSEEEYFILTVDPASGDIMFLVQSLKILKRLRK